MAALEKIFTFLQGQPYRLILFGARREIYGRRRLAVQQPRPVDRPLLRLREAQEIVDELPAGTEFRVVLLTDGILDPDPKEWKDEDVPPGVDLKAHVIERLLALLRDLKLPLYIILIGDPPAEGVAPGDARAVAGAHPRHGPRRQRRGGGALRPERRPLLRRRRRAPEEVHLPGGARARG